MSAISVGYPMVVFETTIATGSMKLHDEMKVLGPLTRITILLLGIYLALKIGDMVVRGSYSYLFDGSIQGRAFLVEMIFGVALPWFMLLSPAVRRSSRWLFVTCALIVGGVALNRINVFLVSYSPPFAEQSYFPSIGEIAITTGLIASIIFFYRVAVTYLPVLSTRRKEVTS
jgi:Ni/Fe-hydrogenase subunit HybB-like protein